MKNDLASALQSLKPGAEWVLRGNEYSGLEWLDSGQTKPTETEVTNKVTALDAAEPMRSVSYTHLTLPTNREV